MTNKLIIILVFFAYIHFHATAQTVNIVSEVKLKNAPLAPIQKTDAEQSYLYGRSFYQAPYNFPIRYEPVEDGGMQINKGERFKFNRHITLGRNNFLTGDLPVFQMQTSTGSGVYANDRAFPLFSREDGRSAQNFPSLGKLKIGVSVSNDSIFWLHDAEKIKTVFRPGYTQYFIYDLPAGNSLELRISPTLNFHGFTCSIEFEKPAKLVWNYGDIYWKESDKNDNKTIIEDSKAKITEKNLPNGAVYVGWNGLGKGESIKNDFGSSVQYVANIEKDSYYIYGTWGVSEYNKDLAEEMMIKIKSPERNGWDKIVQELRDSWFDCYIGRALHPEVNFNVVQSDPELQLKKSCKQWDERRSEFQIHTPNSYLNGIVNFERAISDYHQMGPGLVLSPNRWFMYSHISVGWYGKIWGGDYKQVANYLRLFGAMQRNDGFMPWVSPSLHSYTAENNTPYWVDQVWWIYSTSGDEKIIHNLWPEITKAVEWEVANNDPDGDGLFQSFYEYWNCDSNGKGPKAAAPSTTGWTMLKRASEMAKVVGDKNAEIKYSKLADKTKKELFEQLWSEEKGLLGSIGGNNLWRGHPQTWEQYLGINSGLIPKDKGIRAMRWLENHYGFEPNEDIHLLSNSDWYPIRWSTQWVPVGDTWLAAWAGMQCGDADLWWPYFETAVMSSYRSDAPAVKFGISNTGTGGGGIEFVDADDALIQGVMRGLFGITPEIQNDKLYITPAFPSDWNSASIKSPLVSYAYNKVGNKIIIEIETQKPLIKVVNLPRGMSPVTTPKEKKSIVELSLKNIDQFKDEDDRSHKPIFTENIPPEKEPNLSKSEIERLQMLDLSAVYNSTLKGMVDTVFVSDYNSALNVKHWWHSPDIHMTKGEEIIESENGVKFLLKNRNESTNGKANNILLLSSWGSLDKSMDDITMKPEGHEVNLIKQNNLEYKLPGSATININKNTEKVWLLLQNHVSPIKNYIPNGEIVLNYTTGEPEVISLIPPYNLDCYLQAFSRKGTSVKIGELIKPDGWSPIPFEISKAQANALPIDCDVNRKLDKIEIRAVCSEGIIGVLAVTLLPINK